MRDERWPYPRLAGDLTDLEEAANFLRFVYETSLKLHERRGAAAGLREIAARLPGLAADLEREADAEDLPALSSQVAAALLSQGSASAEVVAGPPLERWRLNGAGASNGLEALATRQASRLHVVRAGDGQLVGVAVTEVRRGRVELLNVQPAADLAWLQPLESALTRLGLEAPPFPSTPPPRVLACARPRLHCLWLPRAGGGETIPYQADDLKLFPPLEPLSEAETLARLAAGGLLTEGSLRSAAARLELVRRVVDHQAWKPATRAALLQHAQEVVSAVDGTTPVPTDVAERFGLGRLT